MDQTSLLKEFQDKMKRVSEWLNNIPDKPFEIENEKKILKRKSTNWRNEKSKRYLFQREYERNYGSSMLFKWKFIKVEDKWKQDDYDVIQNLFKIPECKSYMGHDEILQSTMN